MMRVFRDRNASQLQAYKAVGSYNKARILARLSEITALLGYPLSILYR